MANKTIQELRDFVTQQMPSNSELLVKPFRIFFNYLLDRLEGIPDALGFNQLLQKVFGTTDLNSVNYQTIFGNEFQGNNLIAYLLYLRSTTPQLIDGKIPFAQIPDLSIFYEVGKVITTSSTVELKLRVDENNVYSPNLLSIYGNVRTETSPSLFTFTPVSEGKIKILAIYGMIDLEVQQQKLFFLAEGDEGVEAPEPSIPYGAVVIKRITVTSDEQIQSGGEQQDYKVTTEDSWLDVVLAVPDQVLISLADRNIGGSFRVSILPSNTTPKLQGITTKAGKNIWDGREMLIYNNSDLDIEIEAGPPRSPENGIQFNIFSTAYTLAPLTSVRIKIDGEMLMVIPNGESVTIPDGGGTWNFPLPGIVATELPDNNQIQL